jgi:hypothetical protein
LRPADAVKKLWCAAMPSFHVKHGFRRVALFHDNRIKFGGTLYLPNLFADAEIAENHIQNVLDVDPAGEAPQRPRRQPDLLGDEFLGAARSQSKRPIQGFRGLPQGQAMPFPRDQDGLRGEEALAESAQRPDQGIDSNPGFCRYG